ncbi:putative Autophagy protein Apg9 [Trypanosoma vivax]|uniref:Autophagy-related protein 9 n=1 Tax=Trypanosoma vivax (strain Y486) TaxID=1055687 RepID=G0U9X0_TRYVY|nr:hypothetical protein TRVL_02365 [Trypanosoma vivax]KAH8618997.1 putative Autophagy protein Apg9 [Trypanosoma vivax]CCC52601.1 conserved hypothetical protein [Trypanosoma vivax Y486]
MVFFQLPSFSLRYKSSGRVEDMHVFMTNLYRFWNFRGLWTSCTASFVDFLNSLVVFAVVVFLTTMFDWSTALACDEITCGNVTLMHSLRPPSRANLKQLLFIIVLLSSTFASVCYELVIFISTCKLQCELETMLCGVVDGGYKTPFHRFVHVWRRMRAGFKGHEEGPLQSELPFVGNMGWGEFLETVCARIRQDRSFGTLLHHEFDSLRAIQALMVYDNYLITLHHHKVVEKGSLKYLDDALLKFLISGMFDEFNTLNSGKAQVRSLRWKVAGLFILSLLLYPFIISLLVVRVLVKNAAAMRTDWGGFMNKDWNNRARWTFRLYNEVPHILSARIVQGRQISTAMAERLRPSSSSRRFACRTSSAIVLVTVGLSLMNTSLLVSGSVFGVPLVWWLTLSLAAFSVFNDSTPVQREYSYNFDLERLIEQLHYRQREWFYSGEAFYHALTHDFLKSRISLIMGDVACTLFMPLILLKLLLDNSLRELVDCIYAESVRVDGLGTVVRQAAFDFHGISSANDRSAYDSFSEKCVMSIASFSSVYTVWATQRVRSAGALANATGSGQPVDSTLDRLLVRLHQRVEDNQTSKPYPGHRSPSDSPGCKKTEEDDPCGDNFFYSTSWERRTAHEREQLFVSQLPLPQQSDTGLESATDFLMQPLQRNQGKFP